MRQKENGVTHIKYRIADVDGFNIFYRAAGALGAPKLLLLHGFPSAGHMFRDLIPRLSDRFHVIAPDLPSPNAFAAQPANAFPTGWSTWGSDGDAGFRTSGAALASAG